MHAPYQTRMLLSDVVVNEYSRLWIYLEKKQSIFTARRYASAVYAVVVSLSICLSHGRIVPELLNIGSHQQAVRQPMDSSFMMQDISAKFRRRHPLWGAKKRWDRFQSAIFDQYLYFSEMVQDRDRNIVTMER